MRVIFGGWYQRTTLHLSEIYELLAFQSSKLDLDKEKVVKLAQALRLVEYEREAGSLEFVSAKTSDGIQIRYYEDGLYVLEIESASAHQAKIELERYYQEKLKPATDYIFSLGAPTPKILANLPSSHPVVVVIKNKKPAEYEVDENKYGKVYSKVVGKTETVFKTKDYILVVSSGSGEENLDELLETQIFFREFKDQLEKYLDIHRKIWEEISRTKERKIIRGDQVLEIRSKLDSYQKTINLISSRINQMGAYIQTRAKVARESGIEEKLSKVFQYKFEVLTDTHVYIKEIWKMTTDYLNSAIQIINEVQVQATNNSIQSLRVITTYGVIGGIVGYLSRDSLPNITIYGLAYFVLLIVGTMIINRLVGASNKRKQYKLEFVETTKL